MLIRIHNSYCNVIDAPINAQHIIKERLTYEDANIRYQMIVTGRQLKWAAKNNPRKVNAFKWRMSQLQKDLIVCWYKDQKFPTGHLGLVAETLASKGVKFKLEEARIQPNKKMELSWAEDSPELRHYQEKMLKLAESEHRGVFEVCVGAGKTLAMQAIIKSLGVGTLVLCPARDLAGQTFSSFKEVFGKKNVSMVRDLEYKRAPIQIISISALHSIAKKDGLPKLLSGIDCICIDEVHRSGAKTYTDLLQSFSGVYYRFGFTGTYLRTDSKTLDMWGFTSNVLLKYPAKQAVQEGYLTPLKVYTHSISGKKGFDHDKKSRKKSSDYAKEYEANYCNNPALSYKILQIIEGLSEDQQVLILVKQKDASGRKIHEHLRENGIPNQFISGDDDKDVVKKALADFNEKKNRVLIGSSIIGEGIDIRSTDHLIMAQGGKSEVAVTQAVGRAVRLFPGKKKAFVHDFRFTGTKYLKKHLDERLEIYCRNFDADILT